MNRGEFDERRRTGSVKAAIRLFDGDSILEGTPSWKKSQIDVSEV